MNRITVEQVINAYKETGVKPQQFTMSPVGRGRCCGLGVIVFKEVGNEIVNVGKAIEVLNKLGLSDDYINGFMRGFDGYRNFLKPNDEQYNGWADGYRSRQAAFEEIK